MQRCTTMANFLFLPMHLSFSLLFINKLSLALAVFSLLSFFSCLFSKGIYH